MEEVPLAVVVQYQAVVSLLAHQMEVAAFQVEDVLVLSVAVSYQEVAASYQEVAADWLEEVAG